MLYLAAIGLDERTADGRQQADGKDRGHKEIPGHVKVYRNQGPVTFVELIGESLGKQGLADALLPDQGQVAEVQVRCGHEVEVNAGIAGFAWKWVLWMVAAQLVDGIVLTLVLPREVLLGHEGSTIVDYAEDKEAGLVVIATHGRTGLGRLLFGSVADYVIRHAPCPVLTLRARKEDDGD